jgi:threonylcarbamoyladenosine tRNA methylthiotransferase MtaB
MVKKTVALHTLGCKLNFSETTAMGRLLEQDGFHKVEFEETADVYVINTCSVTENADKECRQLVRRIQRKAPGAIVVISGCYAQLKPEEIAAIPGVDLVLGAAEKFNISHHLREISKGDPARICSCDIEEVNSFIPSHSQGGRTRVFMKVQDGCDYNCSFCTIPLARGKSRSNSIEKVMEDIHALETAGTKEIVLTGINLGDFGKGFSGGKKKEETFFELMEAIEENAGVARFRISSIEPNLLEDRMIRLVAGSGKFMPHFHIPLQSGSNMILASMRRRYKRELYAEKVDMIKTLMPHACIGVDVITGFPGETEESFEETMHFLQQLDVSYLHVFTYSERDDTYAIGLPGKVPVSDRNDRTRLLRTLSYRKSEQFARSQQGEKRKVLFEGKNKNGMMEGYTDNYIKVVTPYRQEWENAIVEWML